MSIWGTWRKLLHCAEGNDELLVPKQEIGIVANVKKAGLSVGDCQLPWCAFSGRSSGVEHLVPIQDVARSNRVARSVRIKGIAFMTIIRADRKKKLLNVSPALAPDDQADCVLRYSESLRQLALSQVSFASNRNNVARGELSGMIAFSQSACLPPLCNHISDVVNVGSEEKVGRIDAHRIVASVENPKAIRNLSDEKLKGHSVRATLLAIDRHCTVTALLDAANPFNATAMSLLDLAKKSFLNRYASSEESILAKQGCVFRVHRNRLVLRVEMAKTNRLAVYPYVGTPLLPVRSIANSDWHFCSSKSTTRALESRPKTQRRRGSGSLKTKGAGCRLANPYAGFRVMRCRRAAFALSRKTPRRDAFGSMEVGWRSSRNARLDTGAIGRASLTCPAVPAAKAGCSGSQRQP